MNIKALLKGLEKGDIAPVYICYGLETYLLNQFIRGVEEAVVEPELREFAVIRYDLAETPLSAVIEDAQTLPFFAPRKVIIASRASMFGAPKETGKKDQKIEHKVEQLTDYLKQPADFTVLIFVHEADKLDERKKIVKAMHERKAALNFASLSQYELTEWIREQAKSRGIVIQAGAIDKMILIAGNHLQMLDQELDKLKLHVGQGGTVTETLVDQLVSRSFEQSVFLLIEEMVRLRLDSALDMLHELLRMKEEPIKISSLFARQFRMMYQVKELEKMGYSQIQISSQIGAQPFVVKKISDQVKGYTTDQLTSILSRLADLDFQLKSGKIDKVLGIELFILKMAK